MTRQPLVATIDVPIWNGGVVFLAGGTPAQVVAFVASWGHKDPEAPVGVGMCYTQESTPTVVWVKSRGDVATLVHEIMHTTFNLLGSRGLLHCDESEEAYTYTAHYILEEALKMKNWKPAKLD